MTINAKVPVELIYPAPNTEVVFQFCRAASVDEVVAEKVVAPQWVSYRGLVRYDWEFTEADGFDPTDVYQLLWHVRATEGSGKRSVSWREGLIYAYNPAADRSLGQVIAEFVFRRRAEAPKKASGTVETGLPNSFSYMLDKPGVAQSVTCSHCARARRTRRARHQRAVAEAFGGLAVALQSAAVGVRDAIARGVHQNRAQEGNAR